MRMKLELLELYDMVKFNVERMKCGHCHSRLKFVSIDQYVSIWVMLTVRCVTCNVEAPVKAQVQD